MKLYEWQLECLKAWENNRYRGIVHVVTGAGKTVFALEAMRLLIEKYPDLKVRIVVPTLPLASQWKQALLRQADCEQNRPGFFGGGVKDDPRRKIMIYIINSARNSLAKHVRADISLGEHVLLICDECHHYQSKENRKIFDFLTPQTENSPLYSCLGLSATPFGTENDAVLRRALGREIYRYGFDTAVEKGTISPFSVCEISVSFLAPELQEYAELSERISILHARLLRQYPHLENLNSQTFIRAVTAIAKASDMDPEELATAYLLLTYTRKEISVLAEARIRCCLSLLKQRAPGDRILIFCERIRQAETMARAIQRNFGSICGLYHSEMSKEARTRVMRDFRENNIHVLVSCRCLDEGIDVPDANIGIVLSSSSVERQRIQRLGRVIRRTSGKSAACLYYLYIRESTDDSSYLPELESARTFDLRYFSAEETFSNDFYEYAAGDLLSRAAHKNLSDTSKKELRRCLVEGIPRADYLLDPAAQAKNAELAGSRHIRNYWKTMQRIGKYFR